MHAQRENKEFMWTWKQFYDDSVSFAKSLNQIGVDPRKAINICGFNSAEWAIAFFGGVIHNNVVSGVYTTNGAEACLYQA